MMRFAVVITLSALALQAAILSAIAEETVPQRTPWQKADPASDDVVRWVVEGCAAYPVTAEGPAERPSVNIGQQAKTDLPVQTKRVIDDR